MRKEKEVVRGSKLSWALGSTALHHNRLSLMLFSGQRSDSGLRVSSRGLHSTNPLVLLEGYHWVGTEQCPGPAPTQGASSRHCPLQRPQELGRGRSPFSPAKVISGSMSSSHSHRFPTGIQKTIVILPHPTSNGSVVVFKINHRLPLCYESACDMKEFMGVKEYVQICHKNSPVD